MTDEFETMWRAFLNAEVVERYRAAGMRRPTPDEAAAMARVALETQLGTSTSTAGWVP